MIERPMAAELDGDTVVRVIVGTAEWAVEHLGGTWVDSLVKVGAGWTYTDGQLVPPPAPEPDPDALDD